MKVDREPYPYTADFILKIRDSGPARLVLHAPDFSWNAVGTLSSLLLRFGHYHGTWGIGNGVHLAPGGTTLRDLAFLQFPRGSAVYALDVSLPGGGSATIGTYAVAPNGRKPDCP